MTIVMMPTAIISFKLILVSVNCISACLNLSKPDHKNAPAYTKILPTESGKKAEATGSSRQALAARRVAPRGGKSPEKTGRSSDTYPDSQAAISNFRLFAAGCRVFLFRH
jgi:hypothetical protein